MRDIFSDLDHGEGEYDPVRRAQKQMQKPLPKRFYKEAATEAADDRYHIVLDGRPVRTPARHLLALPTVDLAEATAAEWQAQGEFIDPDVMPLTRLANTALDGVSAEMDGVREDVLRYAGTDLLCYRASQPERLVAMQSEEWDPVVDWAASSLGARFVLAEGVMHTPQPREAIAAFDVHLRRFDNPLALAALHVATALGGSALLALALAHGHLDADAAWKKAHLDERWNEELWGEDYEALKRRQRRFADFEAAARVLASLR